MKIRRGPYGQYLIENISDNNELYTYAEEVINSGLYKELLPVYIDTFRDKTDISIDITDNISIFDYTNNKDTRTNINKRREAIKDFFLSLSSLTNNLLFPCSIVLNPKYVFTNPSGTTIKVCMLPIKHKPQQLCLSSIDLNAFENLLNLEFFKAALTNDEIQSIIYAVSNNDYDRLNNIVRNIVPRRIQLKSSIVTIQLLPLASSLLLSLFAFSKALTNTYMSLFFFAVSGIMLILGINDFPTSTKSNVTKVVQKENNNSRKEIFFNDKDTVTPGNRNPLFLQSEESINGNPINYAMYTDRTVIGSDCFLSDICLNKVNVDHIQAEIIYDKGYHLVNKSLLFPTCLEHRQVRPNQRIEIKDGQILTVGDVNFKISIGY